MKELFLGQGVAHSILLLAFVMGIGIYLGRFKFKGISLGSTWILFIGILTGAFMFASDLMKAVNIPCEIAFWKLSSYSGTQSTGQVTEQIPITQDIKGRNVVIVEDIIDTGYTMQHILAYIRQQGARSVRVCTFFQKPAALKVDDLQIDYVAIKIPNDFIVGYGLDYNGFGRNLPDIYQVV